MKIEINLKRVSENKLIFKTTLPQDAKVIEVLKAFNSSQNVLTDKLVELAKKDRPGKRVTQKRIEDLALNLTIQELILAPEKTLDKPK